MALFKFVLFLFYNQQTASIEKMQKDDNFSEKKMREKRVHMHNCFKPG